MVNVTSIGSNDYSSLQNSISLLKAQKAFNNDSADSADSGVYVTDTIDSKSAKTDTDKLKDKTVDKSKSDIKADNSEAAENVKDGENNSSVLEINYGKKGEENEIYHGTKISSVTKSFEGLVAEVGAVGNKITKTQLMQYLNTLRAASKDGVDNSQEIALVKNLIARFDALSNGADYITSLDGINEAQDYNTVTAEQVTPPFNIAI